jgi:hypothetical protein
MSDNETNTNPLSDFMRERASVVISDLDRPGGLDIGEALAWRHWFAERQRRLQSSGGRPTNPEWTMKRQVPLSPDTWEGLERRAEACSAVGHKIGPGQMAGFLLEEAVAEPRLRLIEGGPSSPGGPDDLNKRTDDPQFDDWNLLSPFVGAAA